jgi:hypothetical protein
MTDRYLYCGIDPENFLVRKTFCVTQEKPGQDEYIKKQCNIHSNNVLYTVHVSAFLTLETVYIAADMRVCSLADFYKAAGEVCKIFLFSKCYCDFSKNETRRES